MEGLTSWIFLGVTGALGAIAYKVYGALVNLFKKTFTVEIKIQEREAFRWMAEWLAIEGEKAHCQLLTGEECDVEKPGEIYDPLRSRALFVPGEGGHTFYHEGRRIRAQRSEASGTVEGHTVTSFSPESITLRMWGRETWRLKQVVLDAELAYRERRNHKLSMWICTGWGDWNESDMVTGRTSDTVILPEGMMEGLLTDVRKFLGMKERYQSIGVPYRRGYIFHGLPGCGKSSLAKVLATECGLNLYVISLSSGLNDAQLQNALRKVKPHSVVLMEDVEAAYKMTGGEGDPDKRISRSGLLNALDGVSAAEGRVLIMTTNDFGSIDDALIRPGRVDMKLELKPADEFQAQQFFSRFFPQSDGEAALQFAAMAAGATPASIQGHLLKHWSDPQLALSTWTTEK